jgi:hypothetical protein
VSLESLPHKSLDAQLVYRQQTCGVSHCARRTAVCGHAQVQTARTHPRSKVILPSEAASSSGKTAAREIRSRLRRRRRRRHEAVKYKPIDICDLDRFVERLKEDCSHRPRRGHAMSGHPSVGLGLGTMRDDGMSSAAFSLPPARRRRGRRRRRDRTETAYVSLMKVTYESEITSPCTHFRRRCRCARMNGKTIRALGLSTEQRLRFWGVIESNFKSFSIIATMRPRDAVMVYSQLIIDSRMHERLSSSVSLKNIIEMFGLIIKSSKGTSVEGCV